jgi:hypothetical protein
VLEQRLQTAEEKRAKEKEECPEGVDVSKIMYTYDCQY